MASEITYAEVKFKNAPPAAAVEGKEWVGCSGEGDLEGWGPKNREWRCFLLWLWLLPGVDKLVRKRSYLPLHEQETRGGLK